MDWARGRLLVHSLTLVLLGVAAAQAIAFLSYAMGGGPAAGADYGMYLDRAGDWLAGGSFYRPNQLSGEPYPVTFGDAVYPPPILLLLVPFTVLPPVLWWAIPLGIIATAMATLRPSLWGCLILAAVLVYPRTQIVVLAGNPSMWALAAIAAGLAWRWPAAFVVLKPTLVPFALLGITRRAWWRGAALALLLAVPFAALWLDYAVALTNARNPELGLNYLLGEWPIAIGIVLAGVFSHRGSETLQMLRVPLDRKWSDPHT